ncbi:hypothetical protein N7G274_006437 [Stereocaulon virgatum]|uniref:arginyltransferase n=1 Tax=Stereocaulon virgatum TaxID=373712 RepID=A0ABR4A4Z1_9LECA
MQTRPSPATDDGPSFLTPTGYGKSSCGYCKANKRQLSSASYGAISAYVRPSHYQILVDLGWRRSGTYYYKPDNAHSCCPHYTVRLDATAFDPRRDQRQAINKWSKYILGTDYIHLTARFCPKTRDEKKRRKNVFDVCRAVTESEYRQVKRPVDTRTKRAIEPAHNFEVALEPDSFTDEKYMLFAHYQRVVHHEGPSKISKVGFKRFLCSGLEQTTLVENGKEKKIGSYHQCYRLDGKLIALGVLDLLPHCVSSVYLIYHEDVNDWNFGKLSALREIALALEGGYKYYYMGYYIHSCIKMRYKGTFRPQYVLDPHTNTWDPLDADMLKHLSDRTWVSMSIERYLQTPQFQQKLDVHPVTYKTALEYVNASNDRENSDARKDANTVFEAHMPGAMTVDEVREQIDLDHWRVQIGDRVVQMEDLVSWDEHDLSEPRSLKGVVAELAACIGPQMVRSTILNFG